MNEPAPHPPGQKAGRVMLLLAWLGVLGLLTVMFGDWEDRQANPNRDPASMRTESGLVEVVLLRNRQGHYVADGLINDHPVTFLLDTGATDVVLPAEIAEDAGLRRGARARARTAAGVVDVWQTSIRELQLGGIQLHDLPATINPHMSGTSVLLGMSALKRVEFQQSGKELRLRYRP